MNHILPSLSPPSPSLSPCPQPLPPHLLQAYHLWLPVPIWGSCPARLVTYNTLDSDICLTTPVHHSELAQI
ncbi:mCG147143 [Mus musculus]|nr:mCG147143 [Mus musculus]